jgi:tetratricopeptide (TPR) repeat protein
MTVSEVRPTFGWRAQANNSLRTPPFHAIIEMLSQWLELQGGTNLDERVERLEQALASAGLKLEDAAPLIADLLQLPIRERYPAITLNPEQTRRRLLAALTGWVFGAARLQPVVMVVEDLHWLDPSTLEFEQLLAEQGVMVPLLLVCTARPEFHAQWPMHSHHTQITLNRLSARNVREMIAQVAARKALASESVEALMERTGGVPLFVEELTRTVLESGAVKLSANEIPVTLHDSLIARLDRLGSAKDLLQIGSVIGGEFSYELLRAVHPVAEEILTTALRSAADAELIYVRGIAPNATYQFKHALIRDAAYQMLLRSRRKELHTLVARTIEQTFPSLRSSSPQILARHWTEAGAHELAIAEWSRAGKMAEDRAAFNEASESYEQALELLNAFPESGERDRQELPLRQSAVRVLQMTRGFAAEATTGAVDRLAAVVERIGDVARRIDSLIARATTAYGLGNLSTAINLADEALDLSLRDGSRSKIAVVHTIQILARFWHGDFTGVEKHFAAIPAFVEDPGWRQQYPGAEGFTFGIAAWNAWLLGRSELALDRIAQTSTASGMNPYDLAVTRNFSAVLRLHTGDWLEAEALAASSLAIAEENKYPQIVAYGSCALGQARAQIGLTHEGIQLIRKGISMLLELRSILGVEMLSTYLALAQQREGAVSDALETLERHANVNNEILAWRPEALRVRGELRLLAGQTDQADSDFQNSIALARKMGAKVWELRTTMNLVRLLRDRNRRDLARTMLTDIYSQFTEGFDTADLKDAKALLVEMAR